MAFNTRFALFFLGVTCIDATSLIAQGQTLTLDGAPYQIFSGAMHYFRVPPSTWSTRLRLLKAAGLNTVETYVPWNLHEPQNGTFDFTGYLDLEKFIETAASVGLNVIFRPGPYICAEWEWGGHPYWLLKDRNMRVRTLYPGYVRAVEAYFARLLPLVTKHQHGSGGPIIAVQVENEYGAYGSDRAYLGWMRQLLLNNGISELLFTSDGPPWLANGTLPGLFTVVNFQDKPTEALDALATFQPNRPLMVGEFWSGWFDHWGQEHHIWSPDRFEATLKAILARNASFNLYMFHGGTNFGFMNGANRNYTVYDPLPEGQGGYQPTVTSYDYDAPLSEAGWTTAKYFIVQQLMAKHNPDFEFGEEDRRLAEEARQPMEMDTAGPSPATPAATLSLIDALKDLPSTLIPQLVTMESLGQDYGFTAYKYAAPVGAGAVEFSISCADRCHVIVNGRVAQLIYNTAAEAAVSDFTLTLSQTSNTILLLNENMGRVNYEMAPKRLDGEWKGITGRLLSHGKTLNAGFFVTKLTLDAAQMAVLSESCHWAQTVPTVAQSLPSFYRLPMTAVQATDSPYIDLQAWSKGVAILNGKNLGRYWTPLGPATTMYYPPEAMLSSNNELILLELDRQGDAVAFVGAPNYGKSCNMPCFWNNAIPSP